MDPGLLTQAWMLDLHASHARGLRTSDFVLGPCARMLRMLAGLMDGTRAPRLRLGARGLAAFGGS